MSSHHCYRVGQYVVDPTARKVLLDETPVEMPWRCFEALRMLIEARGQLVDRNALFGALWPGIQVEETSLTKVMTQLRRVLANGDEAPGIVETVPRLGYRLRVPVETLPRIEAAEEQNQVVDAGSSRRSPGLRRSAVALAVFAAALVVLLCAPAVRKEWNRRAMAAKAEQLAEEASRLKRMGDPASMKSAVEALIRATELNPRGANHFAMLAQLLTSGPDAAITKVAGREAAERAVALDPNCSSGHGTLGFLLFAYFWDWEKAEFHLQEAQRLSRGSSGLSVYTAMFLSTQRRLEEALRQVEEGLRRTPYFATGHEVRSMILLFLGRYSEALQAAGRALSIKPRSTSGWDARANALLLMGREREAVDSWVEAYWGPHAGEVEREFRDKGLSGALTRMMELSLDEKSRRVQSIRRARWKTYLGDFEGALDELDVAFANHHFSLMYVNSDPFFKPIRETERFQQLIARMGLSRGQALAEHVPHGTRQAVYE
jgi:DNA-binding winged helix-turn-helix (wHTH) protein/tetratricopeptide (TPR) repeat protein